MPLYQWSRVIGAGAPTFWQTGAAGCLLFTSPLLASIGIAGPHRSPARWPIVLLYFFLGVCLFANLALNIPVINYHYYYARYLLSEVVPYSVALAVTVTCLTASRRFRALGAAAIVLAIPLHFAPHGSTDAGPRSRACANAQRCGAR